MIDTLPPIYVSEPEFDDMGEILDQLQIPYQDLEGTNLAHHREGVALLNCSSRLRPSGDVFSDVYRDEDTNDLVANLRQFVQRGGAVLASDWACGVLVELSEARFTELVSEPAPVEAEIENPEFAEILGQTQVRLQFHGGSWYKPTRLPEQHRVLLRADEIPDELHLGGALEPSNSVDGPVPVAYQYPFGDGSIVYTAFHNHEQPSEIERALLRLLIAVPISNVTDSTVTDTYTTITAPKTVESETPANRDTVAYTPIEDSQPSDEISIEVQVIGSRDTSNRTITLPSDGQRRFGREDFELELDNDELRYISGEHFEFHRAGSTSSVEIVDVESTNGTEVNGYRLDPHTPKRIDNGTEITLADGILTLVIEAVNKRVTS